MTLGVIYASMLDVSLRAGILNLMLAIRNRYGIAFPDHYP